jgi:hypothetical protein
LTDALTLPFASEATVDRISDTYAEPDWMRAERHDGLRRAAELPVETNPLFTLYVDLRAARLAEIVPHLEVGDAPEVSPVVPEGAAGIIAISDDRVVARGLSAEAARDGVVLDTLAHALTDRPTARGRRHGRR